MGISHLRLFQLFTMRAFIVACFAVASVCADAGADADAYTIAQVQAGVPALKTALDGQTRVVYGLNGVNTVLNRAYAAAPAIAAPVYSSYAARPIAAYSNLGLGLGYHGIYKREAEAEADAYTLAQVALGKPIADAYATGHPHNVGVVTGVSASGYAAPYVHAPLATYSTLGYRSLYGAGYYY